ncbi:two-component regulator propeller domain-containing protein, partial [Arthrospira platensis SPKY1]|nr:two-component regulator propeller domain-containing protein [Arthrospira platensis SPKY1]
ANCLLGQRYSIFSFDELSGLPNSLVKAVAEDEYGFIWVGTDGGLARYDGRSFEDYSNTLSVPYVKDLLPTESGIIVASDEGLFRLETEVLHAPRLTRLFKEDSLR